MTKSYILSSVRNSYPVLYEDYAEAEEEARRRAYETGFGQLIFETIAEVEPPAAINDCKVSKL